MPRTLKLFVVVGLLTSVWVAAPVRGGQELPADLAFVPGDAVGFVHVRLVDIWKSELFKEWRETILKAGDEALAAFDKRFIPAPSSVDRLTVAAVPGRREPEALVILRTSKAIDRGAFFKHTLPGARQEQINGKILIVNAKGDTGLSFVDEQTLAFGAVATMRGVLTRPAGRAAALNEALALAKSGKALVVGLSAEALPPAVRRQVPPPLQPLLEAKMATLTLDVAGRGRIDVRLTYATPQDAQQAEQTLRAAIQEGRAYLAKGRQQYQKKVLGDGKPATLDELPETVVALVALGAMNRVDELLAAPPIKRENTSLHAALELPQGAPQMLSMGAIAAALLVPAVQKVREAATRSQDLNNLKQIALALHVYHDAHKHFPPAAICDAAGKPLLSWRVAILPYLEQQDLFKRFKLDEPWDSLHNKKLIPLMPPTYACPGVPLAGPGETHYRVFVGNGAAFELAKGTHLRDFRDGASNTVLVVQTADSVPWSKPDEIAYDPKAPLPKFGSFYGDGRFHAAFADGSVSPLRLNLPEFTLRAIITRAGGESVPLDP
jgi:uncharacterized protein DUF1559